MITPDICIYHSPCQDGFAAAYAVWKKYEDSVEYFPATYYQDPPDVTDKNVVIVDFSYKLPVFKEMLAKAKSITVLEHHKTAAEDLYGLLKEGKIHGEFDMERSGAVLAWEWFHPNTDVPLLLSHVQDRDLWKFNLYGTREIVADLFSYDYNFLEYDRLVQRCETIEGWQKMFDNGIAIERKHQKDIRELLKLTERQMIIGGRAVPTANLPYTMASDAANVLAQDNCGIGATYFDSPEGRKFSLRSIGDIDVSAVAKNYGGGGHKNASGFTKEIGWEGDF